jgi:hypothetical protein
MRIFPPETHQAQFFRSAELPNSPDRARAVDRGVLDSEQPEELSAQFEERRAQYASLESSFIHSHTTRLQASGCQGFVRSRWRRGRHRALEDLQLLRD